jgi:hypothetical protein
MGSEADLGNVIEIIVDGVVIEVDVDEDTAITDIDEDMGQIASLLGWYGNLVAAAKEHADHLDANYRAWRGRRVTSILAKEPKLAEYKVIARINAERDFLTHKRGQAAADRLIVRLERAWSALDRKASILQSKGALYRSELRATGMTTREETTERSRGAPRSADDRKQAVAGRTKNHGRKREDS